MNFDATLTRVPGGNNTSSQSFQQPAYASQQHLAAESSGRVMDEKKSFGGWMIPSDNWARFALLWSLLQFLVVIIGQAAVIAQHVAEFKDLTTANETYINSSITQGLTIDPTVYAANNPPGSLGDLVLQDRAVTVYEGLFLASQFFQLYMAFDAVITSSKIQLLSQTFFNLAIVAYSVLQYIQSAKIYDGASPATQAFLDLTLFAVHRTRYAEIAVMVLSGVFFAVWCYLSSRLYNIFGWSIFKELGADVGVRQRLKVYQIYVMLLKLDVFFFTGFVIQYAILVFYANKDTTSSAYYLYTYVGPVLAVLLLIFAYFSVIKENNILMTINLIGMSAAIGFLISRLVDIWTTPTTNPKYSSSRTSLTLFTVITLVLSVATFLVAIMNFRNFGKGLMSALNDRGNRRSNTRQNLEMENLNDSRY